MDAIERWPVRRRNAVLVSVPGEGGGLSGSSDEKNCLGGIRDLVGGGVEVDPGSIFHILRSIIYGVGSGAQIVMALHTLKRVSSIQVFDLNVVPTR